MIGESLTEEMKSAGVNLISNCGVSGSCDYDVIANDITL